MAFTHTSFAEMLINPALSKVDAKIRRRVSNRDTQYAYATWMTQTVIKPLVKSSPQTLVSVAEAQGQSGVMIYNVLNELVHSTVIPNQLGALGALNEEARARISQLAETELGEWSGARIYKALAMLLPNWLAPQIRSIVNRIRVNVWAVAPSSDIVQGNKMGQVLRHAFGERAQYGKIGVLGVNHDEVYSVVSENVEDPFFLVYPYAATKSSGHTYSLVMLYISISDNAGADMLAEALGARVTRLAADSDAARAIKKHSGQAKELTELANDMAHTLRIAYAAVQDPEEAKWRITTGNEVSVLERMAEESDSTYYLTLRELIDANLALLASNTNAKPLAWNALDAINVIKSAQSANALLNADLTTISINELQRLATIHANAFWSRSVRTAIKSRIQYEIKAMRRLKFLHNAEEKIEILEHILRQVK